MLLCHDTYSSKTLISVVLALIYYIYRMTLKTTYHHQSIHFSRSLSHSSNETKKRWVIIYVKVDVLVSVFLFVIDDTLIIVIQTSQQTELGLELF